MYGWIMSLHRHKAGLTIRLNCSLRPKNLSNHTFLLSRILHGSVGRDGLVLDANALPVLLLLVAAVPAAVSLSFALP
jgi:hypothetical protein